jgi:hypothetical protein
MLTFKKKVNKVSKSFILSYDYPLEKNQTSPKEGMDMLVLIGGIVSVSLGIILVIFWWFSLIQILAGVVPVILLIGGALAIYLKIDDLRYSRRDKDEEYTAPETFKEPEQPVVEESAEKEEAAVAEKEEAAVAAKSVETEETKEKEAEDRQYWLLGYSAKNIEVMNSEGLIGFSQDKEELAKEKIKKGDLVVLYALSPQSKFAGIVEISGDYDNSDTPIWSKTKEGDPWPHRRKVNVKTLADKTAWVAGKEIIEGLELVETARSKGADLSKAFAAKLRSIPQISEKDYGAIADLIEK